MELPDFFGIDVGGQSIKVAEAKRSGKKAKLQHIAKVDTPEGLIENESEEGMKEMGDKIIEAKEAAGIKTKNCVAAVPESAVFSRLLTIPKVAPDQIEQTVHWEIKPMIPVGLSEVDVAFLDIGEKEVGGSTLIDMYVVAAPKTLTDRYKKITSEVGLDLIALETEALAITRSVMFSKPDLVGDVVVIDFGGNGTNIILARDGVVVFSQTSSTGSNAFTKAISSDYGIDDREAEKYKRAYGLKFDDGDGKIAKSIEPIMQIMMTDIIRTLNYFRERVGGKLADTIFLTGDGANLPGLPGYLKNKLNMEAEIVDAFSGFNIDGGIKGEIEGGQSAGFSVALGLAIKEAGG